MCGKRPHRCRTVGRAAPAKVYTIQQQKKILISSDIGGGEGAHKYNIKPPVPHQFLHLCLYYVYQPADISCVQINGGEEGKLSGQTSQVLELVASMYKSHEILAMWQIFLDSRIAQAIHVAEAE